MTTDETNNPTQTNVPTPTQPSLWQTFTNEDAKGTNEQASDYLNNDLLLWNFEIKHSNQNQGYDFAVCDVFTIDGTPLKLRIAAQGSVSFLKKIRDMLPKQPSLLPAPIIFYAEGKGRSKMIFIGQSTFDFESAGIAPDKEEIRLARINWIRSAAQAEGKLSERNNTEYVDEPF